MMTAKSAQGFEPWFEETFGAPFPIALSGDLVSVNDRVWASKGLEGEIEAPPMTPEFLDTTEDYAIAGLWGHGVNSSAFYFVEQRGPHRRFFRLSCGGGYADFESEARDLVGYLGGYRAWQGKHEQRLRTSTLIRNMGMNKVELSEGEAKVELNEPGEGAAWWQKLDEATPSA